MAFVEVPQTLEDVVAVPHQVKAPTFGMWSGLDWMMPELWATSWRFYQPFCSRR